jgi:hypothetical protein
MTPEEADQRRARSDELRALANRLRASAR